jgi:hypothetical protein
MQKAAPGITNPTQGQGDFSKREFDLFGGLAMSYFDWLELRLSTFQQANLNRGTSLARPFGYKDGTLVETRFYFPTNDRYDVGRQSFLSLGYYPTKSMMGGDGVEFKPGLYARAYGALDLPIWHSYLYLDTQYTSERVAKPRLVEFDGGLAVRPFDKLQNVEFRAGYNLLIDLSPNTTRHLVYGAMRFIY